jgi:hypothetical protein
MTTIRRNRLPRHPAGNTDSRTPRTPATTDRRDGDTGLVRLALTDPPAERTTLDGARWPRTRSLSDELPGLVEELHRRGVRVTRAAYNPDAWETAPRRLGADGHTIRLGWFRRIDSQLLNLAGDTTRGRLDLLVVPPETAAAALRRRVRPRQPAHTHRGARLAAPGSGDLLVTQAVTEEGDLGGQHTEDDRGDQLPPGRTDQHEGHPRRAEGAPGEHERREVVGRASLQWPAERIREDSSA